MRAKQPRHRGATHTAADAADARSVDVGAEVRVRQHQIEHRFHAERSHRLHFDDEVKVENNVLKIVEAIDFQAGKTAIAMERRCDNVAVTRQPHQKIDRLAVNRAASQPVGEHQHRPAPTAGRLRENRDAWLTGKDSILASALHVWHTLAIRQKIVSAVVGRIGRVAGDDNEIDERITALWIETAIGHLRAGFQGAGGLKQDVADIMTVGTRPVVVERPAELTHPCGIVRQI